MKNMISTDYVHWKNYRILQLFYQLKITVSFESCFNIQYIGWRLILIFYNVSYTCISLTLQGGDYNPILITSPGSYDRDLKE